MLLHCGLLLMVLSYVRTSELAYDNGMEDAITELQERYRLRPSMYNALARIRKRELQVGGLSEGGGPVVPNPIIPSDSKNQTEPKTETQPQPPPQPQLPPTDIKQPNKQPTTTIATGNPALTGVENNSTSKNETLPSSAPKRLDLQNSKVILRGIIVFGGFTLLAVAYYVFYRKKSSKNETGIAHSTNDANQFRYGVLHSEDRRDNLELSRVPLTMESDDDDDEDLEIFDLEQKKKSLSYVNLQTNDEDLVFPNRDSKNVDKDNLLLDIDDTGSETLINWSSNGNKSIL